jgi:hypothetical protein
MILYEFTVTVPLTASFHTVMDIATRAAEDQQDYEIQLGGEPWPPYRVVLMPSLPEEYPDGYLFRVVTNDNGADI